MNNQLSIVILAKNEEQFIGRCIKSVLWADEVLVLDSGSTDRTEEIAQLLGATVYHQDWLGYSAQRNQAISLAKNDWVFFIDCDEIVTPELASSIQAIMNCSLNEKDGYSVNRRGDFYGVLLPNMSKAKNRNHFIRLFNRKYSRYDPEMKVHERVLCSGKILPLEGVLIHWRGYIMDEYIQVFNRYASMEAEVLKDQDVHVNGVTIFIRPILRFLWCYFARGGCFLGTRGLIHAMLKATSEYIRYVKLWEMQNQVHFMDPPEQIYHPNNVENRKNNTSLV